MAEGRLVFPACGLLLSAASRAFHIQIVIFVANGSVLISKYTVIEIITSASAD